MKPVKQRDISQENGECLRACVASLFEMDIDDVPHFITLGEDWWFKFLKWFEDRNINVNWLTDRIPFGAWHIASVVSPRFPEGTHAVVCDPEGEYVFDPHPDVDDPSINGDAVGYYWFTVIDPAKMGR